VTGNDIVDLEIAKVPTGEKRLRFLDKIFTFQEQEIIDSGKVGIWTLWAMKEATYKAHHRRFDLPRSFEPKKIEVSIISSAHTYIEAMGLYNGYTYWGSGSLTSEYVHFSATCNLEDPINTEVQPSTCDIKNRLKQLVSEKTGINIEDISLVKNRNLIPQLHYKNKGLSLPFSISHHGKYAAISYQLINY